MSQMNPTQTAQLRAPAEGWPREDAGPPVDRDSPFLEQQARERRQSARRTRAGGRRHTILAWLVALAIVAAAVYGGIRLTGYRLASASQLELGSATLTATPVSVPSPGDGQVVHVYVHRAQHVQAGTKLMQVLLFGTSARGRVASTLTTITSPRAGIISTAPSPEGDALLRGDALAQIYEPRSDTFQMPIDTETLGRLRKGMHATLTSPALPHPIAAVVDDALQPAAAGSEGPTERTAGVGGGAPETLTLVLRPVHPAALDSLIPGLKATVVVDTASAPKGATLSTIGS